MKQINSKSHEYGLEVNVRRTKVRAVSREEQKKICKHKYKWRNNGDRINDKIHIFWAHDNRYQKM